jgi:hypothetical protein
MQDHAPSGSEDLSGVRNRQPFHLCPKTRVSRKAGGRGRFADRHKTISSPVRGLPPLSEDSGFGPRGGCTSFRWLPKVPVSVRTGCSGFHRCPKTLVSARAVHRFPPAPEGAGFRPHGLLWFSPVPEGIGFRQGGCRDFRPCPKTRVSVHAGCTGVRCRPRTAVSSCTVPTLPPVSEDSGLFAGVPAFCGMMSQPKPQHQWTVGPKPSCPGGLCGSLAPASRPHQPSSIPLAEASGVDSGRADPFPVIYPSEDG